MKHDSKLSRIEARVPAPWKYKARRFFLKGTTYTNEDGTPTTKEEIDSWVAGGPRRRAVIRRII